MFLRPEETLFLPVALCVVSKQGISALFIDRVWLPEDLTTSLVRLNSWSIWFV